MKNAVTAERSLKGIAVRIAVLGRKKAEFVQSAETSRMQGQTSVTIAVFLSGVRPITDRRKTAEARSKKKCRKSASG